MERRQLISPPASPAPHPYAELVREMTEEEYLALRDDIQRQGQLELVIFYQDHILDGRHRYRACRDLGISPVCEELLGTEAEVREFVISQNAHRRHLTATERKHLVALALVSDPSHSDRRIARLVGVAPNTVKAHRRALESTAQIAQLSSRKGRDGKSRLLPATVPAPEVKTDPTPADTHAKIKQVRELLPALCQAIRVMGAGEGKRCLTELDADFKAFGATYLPLKPKRSSHHTYGGSAGLPSGN